MEKLKRRKGRRDSKGREARFRGSVSESVFESISKEAKVNSESFLNNKSKMKKIEKYGENAIMENRRKNGVFYKKTSLDHPARQSSREWRRSRGKKSQFQGNESDRNLKKREINLKTDRDSQSQNKNTKRVKSNQEIGGRPKPSQRNEGRLGVDTWHEQQFIESQKGHLGQSNDQWGSPTQNDGQAAGRGQMPEPHSPERQKKKAPILKTAHKVLQKHLTRIKDGLIAVFKEDLTAHFNGASEKARPSQVEVVREYKGFAQIVLKFGDRGEPRQCEGKATDSGGGDIEPVWKSRSGRAVKNKHLLHGIEHQGRMEKLEMSFLKELEKLSVRIGKGVEKGYYVYFRDYLVMLRKRISKMLAKFPFMSRKKVIRLLASDIVAVRDDFTRETQLEHSKLASHMEKFRISSTAHPRTNLQSRIFYELTGYRVPESLEGHLSGKSVSEAVRGKYSVETLLRSDKAPMCKSDCACCVQTVEAFCDFKATQCGWESGCDDKRAKVECDSRCGCDEQCQNSFIRKRQYLESDKQISIRQTWGIDFYSHKNLFHLLPLGLSVDQKKLIIDSIVRQLNFLGHEGWNVLLATQTVSKKAKNLLDHLNKKAPKPGSPPQMGKWTAFLEKSDGDDKATLKELIRGLNVLVKQLKIKQLRDLVRAFSKGLGVVCTDPAGIASNSLVVQYFGEVFPPWLWYLKQDAIKQFLGQLKRGKYKELSQYRNNYSMEFYNIFLEKHRDEPKGTQLVIIDPIFKGNYASRLSHSCNPNCITLPVVSDGQYSIGTPHSVVNNRALHSQANRNGRRADLRLLLFHRIREGVPEFGVSLRKCHLQGLLLVLHSQPLRHLQGRPAVVARQPPKELPHVECDSAQELHDQLRRFQGERAHEAFDWTKRFQKFSALAAGVGLLHSPGNPP